MGTRNLTAVVIGGNIVVAQYCQWDGYPGGQGAIVLDFIANKMNKETFLEKLKNCRFGSNVEIGALWNDFGADDSGWASLDIHDKFKEKHPHLERGFGADILEFIQNSEGEVMLGDDRQFAADSLFCEWAYLIDFDENVLNVYSGFSKNTVAPELRFPGDNGEGNDDSEYTSISMVVSYSLDSLPTQDEFESDLEEDEDDDE